MCVRVWKRIFASVGTNIRHPNTNNIQFLFFLFHLLSLDYRLTWYINKIIVFSFINKSYWFCFTQQKPKRTTTKIGFRPEGNYLFIFFSLFGRTRQFTIERLFRVIYIKRRWNKIKTQKNIYNEVRKILKKKTDKNLIVFEFKCCVHILWSIRPYCMYWRTKK